MQGPLLLHRTVCILWPLVDGTSKWCSASIDTVKRSKKCRRGSWFKYGLRFSDEQDKIFWSRLHHLTFELVDVSVPSTSEAGSNNGESSYTNPRMGINSRESIDLLMPTDFGSLGDCCDMIPPGATKRKWSNDSDSDVTTSTIVSDYDSDITTSSGFGQKPFKRRC